MTEQISKYVVGFPEEIALSTTFDGLHPDILLIQGEPLMYPYGELYYGLPPVSEEPIDPSVLEQLVADRNRLIFVIVPLLDFLAGLWNRSTWSSVQDSSWKTAYRFEILSSLIILGAWVTTLQADRTDFTILNTGVVVYAVIEVLSVLLVFAAQRQQPNE